MAASAILLPLVTPPTYHRIVSPTLRIPSDPQVSIPVGLLACQRDPVLCDLPTTVVSCSLSQSPTVPSNGRKGKKEKTPQAPAEPLLEVILHDTVLFPEGGGQPSDIGILTSPDGEQWNVVEVKRHGGHAVHYIHAHDQDGQSALCAFPAGAKVGVALGEEGLKRRLDHMSMHTSQHLLSALLETRLNLSTLSWSLTAFPTPSYVEIPRGMTPDEIASIQEEANRLVFEGRSVHVEVEELDREKLPDVAKLGSGRSVGKGLPSDYTGGVKRTVLIDGVDRSPCCGTHMPTLHNHQIFILPHTDTLSRSNTTSARLYWLAGPRLITYLTSTHTLLTRTAATMSCGGPQVPERVEQVVDERKRAVKRVEDIEAELASVLAKDIINSAPGEGKEIALHRHRIDDTANALGFLSAISTAFVNEMSSKPDSLPFLVVLTSSPSSQTATSTSVVLIFGSNEKKVKEVGEGLKKKSNVKGGGKGTRWSGKFTGVWKDSREGAAVAEVLKT